MAAVEFWPDYGDGPLWTGEGVPAAREWQVLPADLSQRLKAWNRSYDETKLPIDGPGDATWLAEGQNLVDAVRAALAPHVTVVTTEPWWNTVQCVRDDGRRERG